MSQSANSTFSYFSSLYTFIHSFFFNFSLFYSFFSIFFSKVYIHFSAYIFFLLKQIFASFYISLTSLILQEEEEWRIIFPTGLRWNANTFFSQKCLYIALCHRKVGISEFPVSNGINILELNTVRWKFFYNFFTW